MLLRRRMAPFLVILLATGCAKPSPTLTPTGVRAYYADEAVVALGTLQHTVIELNGIKFCQPQPCTPVPLVSTANTRKVIDVISPAIKTLRTAPADWQVTANTAIDEVGKVLDEAGRGKLRSYLEAAKLVLNAIPRQ